MTGRAFGDLEKRSRAINRKKYFKIFIILLLIFVACTFAYIEFMKSKQIVLKKNIFIEKKIPKVKKSIINTNITKIIKQKEVKAKIDKIQKYDTVFLKPTITVPKIEKREIKNIKVNNTTIKKIDIPKIEKVLPNIQEKKKINITVKSLKDEESLLKTNKANESFETTLKLSKYYFEKSKFEKAILWSKKANHFKSSSFEPWLIYAKAKIKQNKKDEAIKAIETFLSYYNSDAARKFLQNIKGQE